MKNNSRALRRHHRARLKIKRQFHWGYGRKSSWSEPERGQINFMNPRTAGFVVNTATPCSCWMCHNPRRVGGWSGPRLTMQELKALDAYYDSMEEAGIL